MGDMDVRHDDKDLGRLEADPNYRSGLDMPIVRAFHRVMLILRAISNETGLYSFKSLRCKKLQGKRSQERSLRLNDQWRLIVALEKREGGNLLVVKGIEDYH